MYTETFSFINKSLSFYASRFLTHFFVLSALLAHQFLVVSFIDVHLSVFVYSLCFCVFTIDSLCLFFYRADKNKELLNAFLLFVDALFFTMLLVIMDSPFNLFFVFVLLIFHSLLLILSQKTFQMLIFFLSLSILFPVAFLSFESTLLLQERLSLILFLNISFLFLFLFNLFFKKASLLTARERELSSSSTLVSSASSQIADYIHFSLDFCRKLKPGLNSLIKYFPEESPSSKGIFPVSKGRQQLEQMRKYISDFIEYAEPEMDSLTESPVDLKKLLQELLQELEEIPQRPEGLILHVAIPDTFQVHGSAPHLKKCFKHILMNSFEALKNQNDPQISLRGWLKKEHLILEFFDDGHGIKPEDMKKLFDPLFSQRFGLRGLGLPYVQKIVQAHKASLDISSSEKGTKISITFPLSYHFYNQPKLKKKSAV